MEQPTLPIPDAGKRKWVVDLGDLRGELARRHGVKVSRDDPTLLIVTAFEIVAKKLMIEFEGSLERANDDMSALMAQQMESAKGVGVSLVEASAEYHVQKLRGAADKMAQEIADEARKLLRGLAGEIGHSQEAVLRSERRGWMAAGVSAACLLVTVGLIIGRVL